MTGDRVYNNVLKLVTTRMIFDIYKRCLALFNISSKCHVAARRPFRLPAQSRREINDRDRMIFRAREKNVRGAINEPVVIAKVVATIVD